MPERIWYVLIGATALVILAAAPLPHIDSDAPLYGRIAADILDTGDWLTFRHPGWQVDKPPVVFWLMALSFRVAGTSNVSLRFWQLVAALALILLTYRAARAAGGTAQEGALAALILGSSVQFLYQATVPQQDVPLTLFLTLASYGLIRYVEGATAGWAVLIAVGVALAVLTKGIAGLVLFAVVLAASLLVARSALPRSPRALLGQAALAGTVFALLALPWFMTGVVREGDPFVRTFLTWGTLGVGRYFTPAISSPPPYWLSVFAYVPILALGLLPWSPVFVLAAAELPGAARQAAPGLRVVAVWFAAIFLLLSLSSGDKVFRYLLPCLPPAAILAGRTAASILCDARRLRIAGRLAAVPAAALLVIGFLFLWSGHPGSRDLLAAVVLPAVVAVGAGMVGFGLAAMRGRGQAAVVLAAVGTLAGFGLFERNMMVRATAINPWPAIAAAAAPLAPESHRLVLYGRAGEGFNFAHFYLDEPVVSVLDVSEIAGLWARERIIAVVPEERLEELAGAFQEKPRVILNTGARLVVVTNWTEAR
jgi:4-amino-4-deoxy-L-arabinose transferase-like glycosyltransferase